MLNALPHRPVLIGDHVYDNDRLHQVLRVRGTHRRIPGRAGRTIPIRYSKRTYRDRRHIEIMLGRFTD